ncbi:MAG: hypothetical protein A2017_10025 [Lentisphaerae bacterium GWF2_44_16]|nr:MAG: hypothetical protein A2017_10025 [Lentisphaerae bacterium GWF2_44_16]
MNDCEFWNFLGNMREQSAAWHDWRHYYGKWVGWEKFRDKYLCLTDEKSDSVECKTMCKEGCWREVFENADEDGLEASCPDGELSYPLTEQDILIYTLYRHEFHKGICSAFNIEHRESEMEDCCMTWRLGDFIPLAGMVFPTYISFPYDREELVETVKHLCLLHDKPFILMCPTREKLYLQAEQLLYSRKALYISLGEEIFFNQDGEINAHRKSEEIFAQLLETLPKPCKPETVFFPTPPDAKWEDLKLHFIDRQNIFVRIGNLQMRFDFRQMGMSNRKGTKPNAQWKLLLYFAENNAKLGWDAPGAGNARKCQKRDLCKTLKDFFRLEDLPINWDEKEKVYSCKFQIRPDTYSTQSYKGKIPLPLINKDISDIKYI